MTGYVNVIRKHVDCVELTRAALTLQEIRLLHSCLYNVNQLEELTGLIPVNLEKFAEVNKLRPYEAFTEAEKIVKEWFTKAYEFPLVNGKYYYSTLIVTAEINVKYKTISIKWNDDFIPLISGKMPPGQFISVNIKMSKTSSKMRYVLYEALQKKIFKLFNKGTNYIEYSVEELRKITDCEDKYLDFGDFNKSVIKPTLDDIYKNTGLKLYATKRRSWTKVKFSLKEV